MSLESVIEARQMEIFIEALEGREVIKYIKVENTLVEYLNLSSKEKGGVEELRKMSPDYFSGILGVISPIPKNSGYKLKERGYSKKILDVFHTVADQNAIERIVEGYVNYSASGNVTFNAWFRCYDSNSGENLQKNGTGSNYYWKHHRLKKNGKTKLDFDSWILTQVSFELTKRLLKTTYYMEK